MELPGADEMEGKVLTAVFVLSGQRFMALDGGPVFTSNEAVSPEQCGWLKDRYGLSWQIVPRQMGELLGSADRKKALAATNTMLTMKKIAIAELQSAFDQA